VLIGGKPGDRGIRGLAPAVRWREPSQHRDTAGTPTGKHGIAATVVGGITTSGKCGHGGFELIVCREWNPVTIEEIVYTGFEMMRDCRADSPEGWRYFAANYVPLIRKFLTHYAGSDPKLESVLLSLRKPDAAMFQSKDPAPERWFIAQMRQAVLAQIDAPETDIPLRSRDCAEALAPLTMVEKQGRLVRYHELRRGRDRRHDARLPETVEKVRARAAGTDSAARWIVASHDPGGERPGSGP